VNLVALVEEELGEIGPVLAGDPADQGTPCHAGRIPALAAVATLSGPRGSAPPGSSAT
jgi:hypothetical protein